MSPDTDSIPESDKAGPHYRLRLFVAGDEPNSRKAKSVVTRLRETILRNRCEIVIVDVLADYQAAIDYQVVAIPTLIVESPPPAKTLVGSLSDESKLIEVLGIPKGCDK